MLGTAPLQQLVIGRHALFGAMHNWAAGRKSRTKGPVHVWLTENGEYLLVDGHHRVFELLLSGQVTVDAEVVGQGYSDYYATPQPDQRFVHQLSWKYLGLEDLVDIEILDDLATQLNPPQVDENELVRLMASFGFVRHPDKPGFWIEPYNRVIIRHRNLKRWAKESADLRQRLMDEIGQLLGRKTWY